MKTLGLRWILPSVLGVAHFLLVGVPFIVNGGGGEGLLYILYTDYPLFLVGRIVCRRLLYNSVAFNFVLFVIGGTLMYALVGYGIGKLLARFRRQGRRETS